MQIETTIRVWLEGSQYIAHAMPIDVVSSGQTPDAAHAALSEAIDLFVSTARSAGTLDDLLEECGYVRRESVWTAPELMDQRQTFIPG